MIKESREIEFDRTDRRGDSEDGFYDMDMADRNFERNKGRSRSKLDEFVDEEDDDGNDSDFDRFNGNTLMSNFHKERETLNSKHGRTINNLPPSPTLAKKSELDAKRYNINRSNNNLSPNFDEFPFLEQAPEGD